VVGGESSALATELRRNSTNSVSDEQQYYLLNGGVSGSGGSGLPLSGSSRRSSFNSQGSDSGSYPPSRRPSLQKDGSGKTHKSDSPL
jgi:hypothetical protein